MTQDDLFKMLKGIILENKMSESVSKLHNSIEEKITLQSPLASLRLDSLRLTWLLVEIEERLNVDASHLSLFNLFSVGDLVEKLQLLINQVEVRFGHTRTLSMGSL